MEENNNVDLAVHEAGHLVFGLCNIYGTLNPLFPSAIWINELDECGQVSDFTWLPNGYFVENTPLLKYKKEACKTIGGRVAEYVLNNRRRPNFIYSEEDVDSGSDLLKYNQLIGKLMKLETGVSANPDNEKLRITYTEEIWNACVRYLLLNQNAIKAIKYVSFSLRQNNKIKGHQLIDLLNKVNKILNGSETPPI